MALSPSFFLGLFGLILLSQSSLSTYVPVYVMLPLDTISSNNVLTDPDGLRDQLSQLKDAGVDGVNTDTWWGLVEQNERHYNWTGYKDLVDLVQSVGLKLQMTMSFHQCGTNQGDACYIPIPGWVLDIGNSNSDIFYKDQYGNYDTEYMSCGIDNQKVLNGRTGVQVYSDFIQDYYNEFKQYFQSTISSVQIGLGPAGELRYPSYQLDKWTFPGIGAFQCYDKYLLASLQEAANQANHSDWGEAGPDNAGGYNDSPCSTEFFCTGNGSNNTFQNDYGQFFLTWYEDTLIQHGEDVISAATSILNGAVQVTAKIAGIHWWYLDPSHAAELTAGYKNDNGEAYSKFAAMFAQHNVEFDFTALELVDDQEPTSCECGPEELVVQTLHAAADNNIDYSGENALDLNYQSGYSQVEKQSTAVKPITSFTYLRLSDDLLNGSNWDMFQSFVDSMHNL